MSNCFLKNRIKKWNSLKDKTISVAKIGFWGLLRSKHVKRKITGTVIQGSYYVWACLKKD
jgi:hypothetical protein